MEAITPNPPEPPIEVTVQVGDLPPGLSLVRVTDEFDASSVPKGLLRAHQVAASVWGRLVVTEGTVLFVWENEPDAPIELAKGSALVIRPQTPHHVVPEEGCRFHVEFFK